MKKIKVFDTTLRDGEQSPGCSMDIEEKLEVAYQLERMNVDVIEAGFAISSQGDFDSIEKISENIRKPIISSLSRALKDDIKVAADALKKARSKRIHTFIATSPIHMEYKLKMAPEKVIEKAVSAVKYAKEFVHDVQFSCEDAGRSEREFLVKIISEVIKAGATVINIPDTVGYLLPQEFGDLIRYLRENVKGIEAVDLAVHCHNDLGLASANTLSGVLNGATQVECTINGIGERAGNAAMEEVVMALHTRKNSLNLETNIRTTEIIKASKLIQNITGSFVQANKAIVGVNAFAHESGIHQDGMLKHKETYEIMDAEEIGLKRSELVLGKHSGRNAFRDKLTELDFDLNKEELEKAFERFKALADKKKSITDEDIESIVADEVFHAPEIYKLKYVQIISGNTTRPTATVQLEHQDKTIECAEIGEGSVDAIYRAIEKLVKEKINLVDFTIHAITEGTDALGEVTVRIRDDKRIYIGRGSSMDILTSSAKAFVAAINKMLHYRPHERLKPTE